MKTIKVLGIIAITMIIGFTFAACGDSSGDKDPSTTSLTGTVSISGTAQVGKTLFADTSSLGGNGTITYVWRRGRITDGHTIGIDNSYQVQSYDVGYTIIVTVWRDGYSGAVTSDPTATVVPANQYQDPVVDDFDIGNLTQTVGYVIPVTIKPKEGKSTGTITIYYRSPDYNLSTVLPEEAGTYTVTFDVAAADGWNAVTGLRGGTLTINNAPPTPLNAQTPVIITQPVGGTTVAVYTTVHLFVEASVSDGGTLSYQWYSNTSASNSGGTSLDTGATRSDSYYPPTGTVGTYYYFVEVTNTIPYNWDGGNKTATVRSNAVEIRVSSSGVTVIYLTNMNEWELTEQTAQADSNVDKVFTVTGTYTTYRWYLDGTQVGTSSSYTFNKPDGVYELIVVATNSSGESRSGRCWITVGLPKALTANLWANGSINDADDEDWYSFQISSGTTYRIWWNDRNQGDSTKTGNVAVSAQYENATNFIFGGTDTTVDSGYTTAQSFIATQTGTVYIRVIPYDRGSSNVGSYGIVYSTYTSRPSTYTVTFNANGGSGSTPAAQTVSAGFSTTLPSGSGLTRDGYVFGGWNIFSDGSGTNYNAGSSYTPTGNITFYARWHIPLTANVWANGNISSVNDKVRYSFPVSSGITYRIWWNDVGAGNSTKTADIDVWARYVGSSSWIFSSIDSGWYTPQSFTATQTGTVEIMVVPNSLGSQRTGTFGIVYSTGTTRPTP